MKTLVELLEDNTSTAGMEYETPNAFSSGSNNNAVNEITYADFKGDQTISFKEKINNSIKEVNTQLRVLEGIVQRANKLKLEMDLDQRVFYKNTFTKFGKIQERLQKLSNNIRELSK